MPRCGRRPKSSEDYAMHEGTPRRRVAASASSRNEEDVMLARLDRHWNSASRNGGGAYRVTREPTRFRVSLRSSGGD